MNENTTTAQSGLAKRARRSPTCPDPTNLTPARKRQKKSKNKSGTNPPSTEAQPETTSLLTLPLEIWTIIIGKLDTKSLYNLYRTNIIFMNNIVKECVFSVNTFATAKSFKTEFFRDIAGHLKSLNLSGVADLTLLSLKPALRKTKHLTDLDVTYTNIIMPDFLKIVKVRPELKSIAINFTCDETFFIIKKKLLSKYQRAFKGFKNVTFNGVKDDWRNRISTEVAVRVLQQADLTNLTFIVNRRKGYTGKDIDWNNTPMIKLTQFKIYFLPGLADTELKQPFFTLMDFKTYEIIIFQTDLSEKYLTKVYATPLLKSIICEKFDVNVESLADSLSEFPALVNSLYKNSNGMTVIFWNKERNDFDDKFSSKLIRILKEYYIFNPDPSGLTKLPTHFKWYYVKHDISRGPSEQKIEVRLDYGCTFKEKEDIKLNLELDRNLDLNKTLIMVNNDNFLQKISHLTLHCCMRSCDVDFFETLFENCESLITLQIIGQDYPGSSAIFKSIGKSKSLKNFYLEVDKIEKVLFTYLSACRGLENIMMHLRDIGTTVPDPTQLFRECVNLYNFGIQIQHSYLTQIESRNIYRFLNNIKSKLEKHSLNISVSELEFRYSPYMNVFNLYQLRPI